MSNNSINEQQQAASSADNSHVLPFEKQHHLQCLEQDRSEQESKPHPITIISDFSKTNRILDYDTFPTMHYSDENKHVRNACHWGQRKLFISEVEFLTEFSQENDVVIYAGSAPGNHLKYLCEELFPQLKFVLIDPNPFNQPLRTVKNVSIMQEYFTNAIAEEFSQLKDQSGVNNILFLSDIRTADPLSMTPERNEECILEDLSMQKGWLEILKPRHSMLKFRLPFTEGKTTYFKGKIYLPVWGRKWTTECRLVISEQDIIQGNMVDYDNLKHSDQMFYFNNVTRFEYLYEHTICGKSEGVDNCYDCRAEIFILSQYFDRFCDTICQRFTKWVHPNDGVSLNEISRGSVSDESTKESLLAWWMCEISRQISPITKRTLVHMPETSQFIFAPTIHLHPQQQDTKEWLIMRNMVLRMTTQKKKAQSSKNRNIHSIQQHDTSPTNVTIGSGRQEQDPKEETLSQEGSEIVYAPTCTIQKKRRRRKHKPGKSTSSFEDSSYKGRAYSGQLSD